MSDKHSLLQRLIANTLLCTFLTSIVIGNPALANSFADGQALGQASTSSISTGISSGSSLSLLPSFGSSGTTDLQNNYPGDGRDSVTSVTDLMSKGATVQDQTCAVGDLSCSARSFATERYGAAQTNNYQAIAQTMRSTELSRNSEDVLGMNNVPTAGGSNVCVETTTTLPDGTKEETCLDATIKQTTYFTKLPTTVGNAYTSPICLDSGYTLNADKSLCVKDVYSCPVGSTLNGNVCENTTTEITQGVVKDGYDLYKCLNPGRFLYYLKKPASGWWGSKATYNYLYCNNDGSVVSETGTTNEPTAAYLSSLKANYIKKINFLGLSSLPNKPVINWSSRSSCSGINPSTDVFFPFGVFPSGTYSDADKGIDIKNQIIIETDYSAYFAPSFNTACASSSGSTWRKVANFSIEKISNPNTVNNNALPLSYSCGSQDAGRIIYDRKYWNGQPDYVRARIQCNNDGTLNFSKYSQSGAPTFEFHGYILKGGEFDLRYSFSNLSILIGESNNILSTGSGEALQLYEHKVKIKNTTSYPATHTYAEASPGCLGGEVVSAGQVVQSAETLVPGTQSGGTMTCKSTLYSCPAGMAMNGNLCEDTNRLQYTNNPDCVNLGYDVASDTEGFLCTTQELTECALMPSDCVETGSTCIYTDKITNSPTFGQCLATKKTYECPVPGETIVSENCSYQPMCIDGNCFTQKSKCPPIPGVNPIMHYDEVCQNLTKETIKTCPVTYTYGAPDENGEKHIIGAEVDTNTCTWSNDATCTVAPIRMITDEFGFTSWPTEANFSCLGDTMELCAELDTDTECTLTSSSNEQFSIDGGTPIVVAKHFDCARTLTLPTDTCTDDFAKMAVSMEASRQAGEYLDVDNLKIFGGEFHRCDRRSVGWGGSNLGSKSCCNISAPDPENNQDVLAEAKSSITMQGAMSLVDYTVDSGSSYVYDFMMDDSFFQEISTKLLGAAEAATTAASQADMLAEQTTDFSNASYGVSYAGVGIAYTGGTAAAGTTVATGGATGTSAMSLGGGFQLQFSPIGLYIYAAIKLYQSYQAALACDEEDYKTATLSKGKLCYSYGTWCEKEESGIFGSTCVKYRTGKCCFNSKLARIINEQGRKQLGLSMEQCGGFTVDQLGALDWSKIDLSEFISDMLEEAQRNLPTANDLQRLNDKIVNNVNASTTGGTQPIDLGVNGEKRVHN